MLRLLLTFMLLCTTVARAADDTKTLDLRASHAMFPIRHVLIERVNGRVSIVSAAVK